MKSQEALDLLMNIKSTVTDNVAIHRLRDAFVAGDDRAYSSIYKLYAKDLYAFGMSLHAKSELIEDSIHDVFVDIYTHRHNLEKVDNLKYYFLAAFRNRLFFLLKKESNTSGLTDKDTNGLEERDFQEVWIENEITSEKKQLVQQLLSKLNQNQREAIYHRFVEGLSLDEISTLMNINYQSTKNLLHRAIKKLRSVAAFTMLFFLFKV